MLGGILAWFILEAVQIPDALNAFDQGRYDFGVYCIALAGGAFLLGYHYGYRGKAFDGFGRRLQLLERPQLLWTVFLIGAAIGFAPLVIVAKGNLLLIIDDALRVKRWTSVFGRGRYGGIRDSMLELQMLLRAILPLAIVIVFDRRQPAGRRGTALTFLMWMVLRELNDGTRGKAFLALGPLLACLYWKLRPKLQGVVLLLGFPVLIFVGYMWSAATVAGRNSGTFEWSSANEVDYVGNEMFRELLFITENVPENIPYTTGETYWVQVVNPVPRFLWPGKPVGDAGLILARAYGAVDENGEPTMTVSPGIIGEMYLNFGLLGVVSLSALGGIIIRAWDRLLVPAQHSQVTFLVYVAGLAVVFISGRSFNMPPLYGLISLYVLLLFLGSSTGARKTGTPYLTHELARVRQ